VIAKKAAKMPGRRGSDVAAIADWRFGEQNPAGPTHPTLPSLTARQALTGVIRRWPEPPPGPG
jgi:hypothetical protein